MQTTQTKWVLGHRVTPLPTSGDYNLVLGESPAGAQGPPPHRHSRYDEVFLVVEGQMEFVLDGTARTARAGDCIDLPKGTLHTFSNTSDRPCKWINIHSPEGFQSFFDTFGVSVSRPDALAQSLTPDRIGQVLEQASQFDMDIELPEPGNPGKAVS